MIGQPLLEFAEVESTNDVAKAEALRGAAEGLVVVADRQTRGRGRRGRVWSSPPGGGLYLSVLLRPDWPAVEAPWLGVLAGLAAWRTARALGADTAVVKWPNDVLAGGRKLAGVLVEPRIAGGRIEFAVVGVGLNVGPPAGGWSEELRDSAISLQELGGCADRVRARAEFCRALEELYAATRQGRASALAGPWHEATGGQPLPVLA